MKSPQPEYNIYATILNSYSDYIHSDKIYSEYWGNSDNPPFSDDEFHEKQRLSLIDKINRVPMRWEDSEKADRGTAFNEIVDCLIAGRFSKIMPIRELEDNNDMWAFFNNRTFTFPISICREFSDYYNGALSQVHTEAILPTRYGDVLLYGYIDELMPTSIHDIKTTGKYTVGKYKNGWQHIVYPYCLNANDIHINDFEYNVLLIEEKASGTNYETFTEYYNYIPETDVPRLMGFVESFIAFLEENRELITDKKIFNLQQ